MAAADQLPFDFDALAARRAGAAGASTAMAHADAVQEDGGEPWSDTALRILADYRSELARLGLAFFLVEDVRAYAEKVWRLPPPPDTRAWGGVIRRASRQRINAHGQAVPPLIRSLGYTASRNRAGHGHPVTAWEFTA